MVLLLVRRVISLLPLTPFQPPPLGSERRLRRLSIRRVRGQSVRCRAEVPQKSLPQHPREEGTADFALAPGVLAFAGVEKINKCRAG